MAQSKNLQIASLIFCVQFAACSKSTNEPFVAAQFEELGGVDGGERMLKVTVQSLSSETVDVELDPMPSQKESLEKNAAATIHCAITNTTPTCALVFPVDTFLNHDSFSKNKDTATFWILLTRKNFFTQHDKQSVTYTRGNVVYAGYENSIQCAGTVTCEHFAELDGASIAFKVKSNTSSIVLTDPNGFGRPSKSLAGEESVLLLDPGKVFANEPLSILNDNTAVDPTIQALVTVQVGTGAAVTGNVSVSENTFARAVVAAVQKKQAVPSYLLPPKDINRRALLVVSESQDKGVVVVGGNDFTFDAIDTFAVMETVKKDSVDCGTYRSEKDGTKQALSATRESVRITVIERMTGETLGTKVIQAKGNPCQKKSTGAYGMGLIVTIENAIDFARTF
jgi:hypothetical protein